MTRKITTAVLLYESGGAESFEVHEVSFWRACLPLWIFLGAYAFWVRIMIQMARMDGMDLTVLGLS